MVGKITRTNIRESQISSSVIGHGFCKLQLLDRYVSTRNTSVKMRETLHKNVLTTEGERGGGELENDQSLLAGLYSVGNNKRILIITVFKIFSRLYFASRVIKVCNPVEIF